MLRNPVWNNVSVGKEIFTWKAVSRCITYRYIEQNVFWLCLTSERRSLRDELDPLWKSIGLSGKEGRHWVSPKGWNSCSVLTVCMWNVWEACCSTRGENVFCPELSISFVHFFSYTNEHNEKSKSLNLMLTYWALQNKTVLCCWEQYNKPLRVHKSCN